MDKDTIESIKLARTLGSNSHRTNYCLEYIEELEAEVQRLREERDACRAECEQYREELAIQLARKEDDKLLRDTLNSEIKQIRAEVQRLREVLRQQREWWRNVPSGVDIDADIDDPCPGDDMAWRAGCAIREIDKALRGGEVGNE